MRCKAGMWVREEFHNESLVRECVCECLLRKCVCVCVCVGLGKGGGYFKKGGCETATTTTTKKETEGDTEVSAVKRRQMTMVNGERGKG